MQPDDIEAESQERARDRMVVPDFIKVGPSTQLISTVSMAQAWGMPERSIKVFLRRFEIPFIMVGDQTLFLWYSLELILHVLLRPGGCDIKTPGSDFHQRFKGFRQLDQVPAHFRDLIFDPKSPIHAQLAVIGMANVGSDRASIEVRLREMRRYLADATFMRKLRKGMRAEARAKKTGRMTDASQGTR